MTHDAIIVANRLIQLGIKEKNPLTPLQIIKLVYICHGFMLGLYKRPLITQKIEAWQYGPVIVKLYDKLKKYRGAHVEKEISIWSKTELDDEQNDIVQQVFSKYAYLSGVALSTLTHLSGTPWQIVRSLVGKDNKGIIPNDIIEDYYSNLCEDGNNS